MGEEKAKGEKAEVKEGPESGCEFVIRGKRCGARVYKKGLCSCHYMEYLQGVSFKAMLDAKNKEMKPAGCEKIDHVSQHIFYFDGKAAIGFCPLCDTLAVKKLYKEKKDMVGGLFCPLCGTRSLSLFIWDETGRHPADDEVEE